MKKIETVYWPYLNENGQWKDRVTTAGVTWEEKPEEIKITYLEDGVFGKAGEVRYLDPWKVKRGLWTGGGAARIIYA
jgi:hypothetical protein